MCEAIDYIDKTYLKQVALDSICWVRALKKLNQIKGLKGFYGAALVCGVVNGMSHAWIEYVRKGVIYGYDPTRDKEFFVSNVEDKL